MKKIMFLLMIVSCFSTFAGEIVYSLTENDSKIDISKITESKVLAENLINGRKVIAVTVDSGASTDVYNRYASYLVFQQFNESNNIRTVFPISVSISKPVISRLSAGIYTVKGISFDGNFSHQVNTTNLYTDLTTLESTLEEFEDVYLNTSIEISK